jgi:SH3 domain-containing YSC84-like protein 1
MLAGIALCAPAGWALNNHDNVKNASGAQERVNAATKIVGQMKQSPGLAQLLDRAQGVFIIPHYREAGVIVGGEGGGGVVLVKRNGGWSDPAFYSIRGGSIGAQVGGEGGSIAMLLMTPRAVDKIDKTSGRWSLNANAGLTVATAFVHDGSRPKLAGRPDAMAQSSDVILWSNAEGMYGGLTASVTDIVPGNDLDRAYYRRPTNSRDILTGIVSNSDANSLRDALSSRVATR